MTIPHCPFTEACRASALRDFIHTPELLTMFHAQPACRETDDIKAARCAALLGLVPPAINTALDYDDHETASAMFQHAFWLEMVATRDQRIIADGHCYTVGGEGGSKILRGFGGRRWRITLADGAEVGTSNLWSQGQVSDRFRRLLPDNAVLQCEDIPALLPETADDIPF